MQRNTRGFIPVDQPRHMTVHLHNEASLSYDFTCTMRLACRMTVHMHNMAFLYINFQP